MLSCSPSSLEATPRVHYAPHRQNTCRRTLAVMLPGEERYMTCYSPIMTALMWSPSPVTLGAGANEWSRAHNGQC